LVDIQFDAQLHPIGIIRHLRSKANERQAGGHAIDATTGRLIEPPRRRQDYPGASRHRRQSSGSLSLQPPSGGSQSIPPAWAACTLKI
jgi:hypothetical protein